MSEQNTPQIVRLRVEDPEVRLAMLSDLHVGSKSADYKTLKRVIQYCLDNKVKVIGGGDYMNFNLKNSKGSVWDDHLTPREQVDEVTDVLKPLADEGLLLFILGGNHDLRCSREVDIEPLEFIAERLKVPYLGPSGFLNIRQPNSAWNIFATHGSGGGGTPGATANKMNKIAELCPTSDLILMGHLHRDVNFTHQLFLPNNSGIGVHLRHHYCTGSFQKFGGYAQVNNMIPNRTGTWCFTFKQRSHGSDSKEMVAEFIY